MKKFEFKNVSVEELRNAISLEYNSRKLSEIDYEEIHSPGEPEDHRLRLKENIEKCEILLPVIAIEREGVILIVDGNHRSKLSLLFSRPCPMLIHQCFCQKDGICKIAKKKAGKQFKKTQKAGWEWFPEED